MQIKDFIAKYGRDELAKVAAKAGTTVVYLAEQLGGGHRQPSPDMARRIATASDGRIKLSDLRPDLWDNRGRAA